MILITLLIAIFSICKAPEAGVLYIERSSGINFYDPLIKAVTWVESQNGRYVYNAKEGAVGWFQIRQCRIDHFNLLTGSSYTLKDCYDYEISRKIFLYFASGKSYERASRNWNGSGKQTLEYWKLIQTKLK